MKSTASILSASRPAAFPQIISVFLLCGMVCGVSFLGALTASAQGTAFTHQGRLDVSGSPATGTYDFQFSIFGVASGGTAVAGATTVPNVAVAAGLFTVRLDFGSAVFTGPVRWLEMSVRPSGGGAYTTLSPRQELTPSPYAIFAATAASAATASGVAANAVGTTALTSGAVTSAKIADGTIAAADLSSSLLGNTFWGLTGNAGTTPGVNFLGTTDNQAVEIRVNNRRMLRLEPADNVIGGQFDNQVTPGVSWATIAGGQEHLISADFSTISGGSGHIIRPGAFSGVIAGGHVNLLAAGAHNSVISGGHLNTIQTNATFGTISGGAQNLMRTLIFGGEFAGTNAPHYSAIGGGELNVVSGADWATVPGGRFNLAGGDYSFAAGHRAKATHRGAFVWADSTAADFFSTTFDQFRVRAAGGMAVVGGSANPALHYSGSRVGGHGNGVGLAENLNSAGQSAPALRVINQGGDSIDGALSVSAHGVGYVATFGNLTQWVSRLSTNGTWTALAFNTTSDRNAKENFQPVDPRAVLEQVVRLPITDWNYKAAGEVRHIGPMAQDFHAAFGVGTDDKHIATVDADGVALAAIQGLNQKVEEQRRDMAAKEDRVTALETTVKQLQAALEQLTHSENGAAR